MNNLTKALGIFPIFRIPQENLDDTIEELKTLAATCALDISEITIQKKDKPDPATLIGSGKLKEIKDFIISKNISVAIFNFELSASQLKNLQNMLGSDIDIYDRSELILEIFRKNARTQEAKLQIELARLQYEMPRLVGKRRGLDQFQIGMGAGTGKFAGRGPGEKQIEYDRRTIKRQIENLQREIDKIESRKKILLRKRTSEYFIITLIGYTNAGKSTLFNRLTESNVITSSTPFSTLDTKSALLKIEGNLKVFVNDTVGFISNIPDHLINSFLTTLEDIKQSGLLIHVTDVSSLNYEKHLDSVNQVLKKLDCFEKPTIAVFNKFDKLNNFEINNIKRKYPNAVFISAKNNIDIGLLKSAIFSHVSGLLAEIDLTIPFDDPKTIAELHEKYSVKEEKSSSTNIRFKVLLPKKDSYKFEKYLTAPKRNKL
ncbi:MAG: GTPase HflX [Planctomycetes bacterium]|nr:GTPase HflX [Planctomycetota bacterium]